MSTAKITLTLADVEKLYNDNILYRKLFTSMASTDVHSHSAGKVCAAVVDPKTHCNCGYDALQALFEAAASGDPQKAVAAYLAERGIGDDE